MLPHANVNALHFQLVLTSSYFRIAIFSLRAVQAHNEKKRFSHGLITYLQVSFGMGFIGIANDLVNIVRVLLVNPTYGPERYPESPAAATKDGVMKAPPPGTPDLTSTRFWIRQFTGIWGLAFLAATVPGIIANSKYARVLDHQDAADSTAEKRFMAGHQPTDDGSTDIYLQALEHSNCVRVQLRGSRIRGLGFHQTPKNKQEGRCGHWFDYCLHCASPLPPSLVVSSSD